MVVQIESVFLPCKYFYRSNGVDKNYYCDSERIYHRGIIIELPTGFGNINRNRCRFYLSRGKVLLLI